jgi:hypothetical protein
VAQPVAVPEQYRCPLCPTHKDDTFFHSKIVGAPICEGCATEISNLVEEEERPEDGVLDRLEAFTGLTFRDYKRIAFEEFIEDFEDRLTPENVEREARVEMAITGRTLEEVTRGWRGLVEHYRAEIRRLEAEGGGR